MTLYAFRAGQETLSAVQAERPTEALEAIKAGLEMAEAPFWKDVAERSWRRYRPGEACDGFLSRCNLVAGQFPASDWQDLFDEVALSYEPGAL